MSYSGLNKNIKISLNKILPGHLHFLIKKTLKSQISGQSENNTLIDFLLLVWYHISQQSETFMDFLVPQKKPIRYIKNVHTNLSIIVFRGVSLCMTKSSVKEIICDLLLKPIPVCLTARCHCLSELRIQCLFKHKNTI